MNIKDAGIIKCLSLRFEKSNENMDLKKTLEEINRFFNLDELFTKLNHPIQLERIQTEFKLKLPLEL